MSQHRYSNSRALKYKVYEFAKDSEIIMMIEQASSPTFFIAEARSCSKIKLDIHDSSNIQRRFYNNITNVYNELFNSVLDMEILIDYKNRIQ